MCPATETTIGFDTALHIATEAIDRLHTTAESHGRVMIVEVMGRHVGWIALHAGLAGGADVILIPEIPFTVDAVCEKIRQREAEGRRFTVIVVAEGIQLPVTDGPGSLPPSAEVSHRLGEIIGPMVGKEVRMTVLGHVQRGGSPSPFDRILATRFGSAAVGMVAQGEFGRMACLRGGKICSVSLEEAVGVLNVIDPSSDYVRAARSVGVSFGDIL